MADVGAPAQPGWRAPGEAVPPPRAQPPARTPYVRVLVGGDRDELRFWESERLHAAGLAGVLRAVLVHFHHMQAGLVLVQGLQNHHLSRREKGKRRAAR